ncbi:MAG TPA: ATP-dependent DNA helicase [Dermatophilaceae bacterium]|nr:ATP-dependent DNA helicase [Dermatophilaceae bacterium]
MPTQTAPLRLTRPGPDAAGEPVLDAAQRQAAGFRGPLLRVLGAPGTGKTTVVVEHVLDQVLRGGVRAEQVLVVAATRTLAAELRQRVTARLSATTTEPMARTMSSFGFGLLRQLAALAGEPTPRLLSGPEQDVVLRDLLAGHAAGDPPGPAWPDHVEGALTTRGFRAELRDLLMRAVERGLDGDSLAGLARRHARPEWWAAAQVLVEYDQVTALSRPGTYDPAWVLTAAADRLEDDPAALARVRSAVRLVVVDDAHELTAAGARLLAVLAGAGAADLVLVGDPDAAVQGFRGADPAVLGSSRFGDGPTVVLHTAYRQAAVLSQVSARVTRRIGAAGSVAHREPATRPGPGRVEVRLLRAVSQEAALVAAELRRAHLVDGLPWAALAVVVRGRGRTATLRRVLAAAGVPVATPATGLPVRDEVAVRPLLTMLDVVLRVAADEQAPLDPQTAADLVQSPIGGADAVSMRRLRRALRRGELAAGGGRPSGDLLAQALLDPGLVASLGSEGDHAWPVANGLEAGVAAARAAGATAETVLWAIWDATGLAPRWRRRALGGGPLGARADRDLDAVLALFDAAAAYVDRLPQAGPAQFLDHIASQDVPGDRLVARAPIDEAVALVSPQAAAGRQWRFVVVAGVQEGVWPDLRLRGSLLGSERLVEAVAGREWTFRGAQAAVRYDETRLFLVAVSRASERLLVTAVRSEDEQPSVYLDLVDPPSTPEEEVRGFSEVPRAMSLAALVADLRRQAGGATGTPAQRHTAARHLARLAREEVPGADPSQWWANIEVSDDRPRREPGAAVSVSPSKIEAFQTCQLQWLLTAFGGEGPPIGAATIGTLVHDIARDLGDQTEAVYAAEVAARWGRLGLPVGWVSAREQQLAKAMVGRLARYLAHAGRQGWSLIGQEVDLAVELAPSSAIEGGVDGGVDGAVHSGVHGGVDGGVDGDVQGAVHTGRARLTGRVDRLERDAEGRLRVLDLKTGSAKPAAADLARHPQLGAYQLAVERGAFAEGTQSAGAALLQLGKAAAKTSVDIQEQAALAQDEDPGWAQVMVAGVAEAMSGGRFAAVPGTHCRRCQVRSSCPVQPEGRRL